MHDLCDMFGENAKMYAGAAIIAICMAVIILWLFNDCCNDVGKLALGVVMTTAVAVGSVKLALVCNKGSCNAGEKSDEDAVIGANEDFLEDPPYSAPEPAYDPPVMPTYDPPVAPMLNPVMPTMDPVMPTMDPVMPTMDPEIPAYNTEPKDPVIGAGFDIKKYGPEPPRKFDSEQMQQLKGFLKTATVVSEAPSEYEREREHVIQSSESRIPNHFFAEW